MNGEFHVRVPEGLIAAALSLAALRIVIKLETNKDVDFYSPEGIDEFCRKPMKPMTSDENTYAKAIKIVYGGNCSDYYKSIIVSHIPHKLSFDELLAVKEIMHSGTSDYYKMVSIENMFA